ncbi:MAG: hypothetical protein HOC38_05070 [Nitrosopumilus sp.]|nr:hypothetical protein [Nitrosopumilus sp.]MBT7473877.1 hypothetical protein [Nitrosopumilus sp.]
MSAIIKHMQTRIISEFKHILFNFLFMHLASALNQQHDSKTSRDAKKHETRMYLKQIRQKL